MPTPKKLIVDSDPAYLETLRSNHMRNRKDGKEDSTEFALYGPQKQVPDGIKHFETSAQLNAYIRESGVDAVLSGVYAERAGDGDRKYGFRIAADEQINAAILLHTRNSMSYYHPEGNNFFGMVNKKSDPQITLNYFNNIAERYVNGDPLAKKQSETPLPTVTQVQRTIPKILQINCAFDVPSSVENVTKSIYDKPEDIAAYVNDPKNNVVAVAIGFNQFLTHRSFDFAEAFLRHSIHTPVMMIHTDAIEKTDGERLLEQTKRMSAVAHEIDAKEVPIELVDIWGKEKRKLLEQRLDAMAEPETGRGK